MWLMTRYGFFSVAVYKPGVATVRARVRSHLEALCKRLTIPASRIKKSSDRDYEFRLELNQHAWSLHLAELAEEQTWSNFKDEAARYGLKRCTDLTPGRVQRYTSFLHGVWALGLRELKLSKW